MVAHGKELAKLAMALGTSKWNELWPHYEQYGRESDLLCRSADKEKMELSGNNTISREHFLSMWIILGSVELEALSLLLS